MWTYGRAELQFQYMQNWPPFDDESRRLELLRSFNQIPGVSIREDLISRRPALDLSVLRDKAAMKRFLDALDWAIEEWKSV